MKRDKRIRHPDLPKDDFVIKFWDFLLDSFYYPFLFRIRKTFLNVEDPIFRGILLRSFYGRKDWFFKVGNLWLEFYRKRGNIYDLMAQLALGGWYPVSYNLVLRKISDRWDYFWFINLQGSKEYILSPGENIYWTTYYYFRLRKTYPPFEKISSWIVYNERDFIEVTNFFTWTIRSFTPIEVIYDFSLDIGETPNSFGEYEGREIRKHYLKSSSVILGFKSGLNLEISWS